MLVASSALTLQGDLGELDDALSTNRAKLQEITQKVDAIKAMVSEYDANEVRLKELFEQTGKVKQENSEVREYFNELKFYATPGQLTNELSTLEHNKTNLQRQIDQVNKRMEPYLPPERLPEEKLKQRDQRLSKVLPVYLRAKSQGYAWVQKAFYADSVIHPEANNQEVRLSRLTEYWYSEWKKNHSGGIRYELLEVGYHGNRIEFISKRTTDGTASSNKPEIVYCKEMWWLDERGKIKRCDEIVSPDQKPEISAGYRKTTPAQP